MPFTRKPLSIEQRRTTCSRDCPDACGIVATVEDGIVRRLTGDPDHPVTRGFLCYRTARFPALQDDPQRVRQPLLRKGGELVPVSLDEALDVAAERLLRIRRESGGAAILHYRSGGSLGLLGHVADRFFERFGPCATKIGDICSGAGEAAQEADFGVSESNDLFDLRHSRNILLWGKNPAVSNVHLVPLLKECRARGGRVALIDPVHGASVSLADFHVAPRPGRDPELGLGIARLLLDEGRIPPDAAAACEGFEAFATLVRRREVAEWARIADVDVRVVAELADRLTERPCAILVGWGLQRRSNGAGAVRVLDALSVLSGNLFLPGGGCSFYFRRRAAFDVDAVCAGPAIAPRTVREPLLGADVLAASDPPIRAIWVTAGNPVAMLPDAATVARAFERTEFVVVVDPFLTDTARRATLVLPAPTLLEDRDLLGAYGHHWLSASQPVVPPPEGVVHEVELLRLLARRVGLAAEMDFGIDEYERLLTGRLRRAGVTPQVLRERAVRNPFQGELAFPDGRVPTPSGKVRLITALPSAPEEDPDYPLWLFSNSTRASQSSQWAPPGPGERIWVAVHPDAALGRRAGDVVVVESRVGRLEAELRLDPNLRRDVAVMPKGGHYDRGQCANVLVEARPTDDGLGAAYLDCRVRLA